MTTPRGMWRHLHRTLWVLAAVAALALGTFWALRVKRSMRRGRGAVFSLSERSSVPARAMAVDLLTGVPDRTAAAALPEDGRLVARRALALAAGDHADFSLTVPPNAVLAFRTGAQAEAGGLMEMQLELLPAGAPAAVLHSRKIPFTRAGPEKRTLLKATLPFGDTECDWRPLEADLSPWTGRFVTLRFRASYAPDPGASVSSATARAFWALPAVWTQAPPKPAPAGQKAPLEAARRGPENVLWAVHETFPAAADPADFPGMTGLLYEGTEFQRVYANRMDTSEALRSLLSSRLPEPPAPGAEDARARGVKPSRAFPAVLRAAGYRTVLIGVPEGDPAAWCALGFDEVRASPPAGAGAETAFKEAARWLAEEGRHGPFFLLVHARPPAPSEDPSPRCWLRAARVSPGSVLNARLWRVLAQAVQTDGALARLWTQLDALGLDRRSLTTVLSLRGIPIRPEPVRRLSDGRILRRTPPRPGLGFREEEVRALWLLKHPALAPGGKAADPAQLLDVAPTVMSLLRRPPEPHWEGRSFAAAAQASGRFPAPPAAPEGAARFLLEGPGGGALILDGHYKYIRRAPPVQFSLDSGERVRTNFAPEELYDLWNDPGEKRNLARRHRHLLARARRAMTDRAPERAEVRLRFSGFTDPPLQGSINCPGGDLWNVSLSTGALVRGSSGYVSFTVSAPDASLSFETWPPPASFICTLRVNGRSVGADQFVVSRLGLPLIESDDKNREWYDGNKYPWMEGQPRVPSGQAGVKPAVYLGRSAVQEGSAP